MRYCMIVQIPCIIGIKRTERGTHENTMRILRTDDS